MNKRALVNDFVTRPSFFAQYPTGQTPAQYVDALNANTGGVLTAAERDALVSPRIRELVSERGMQLVSC